MRAIVSGKKRLMARRGGRERQIGLKKSNGSRQSAQRYCALQAVEPHGATSSVRVDPQRGHGTRLRLRNGARPRTSIVTGAPMVADPGGAMPYSLNRRCACADNQDDDHGGESIVSMRALRTPISASAWRTVSMITSVAGHPL